MANAGVAYIDFEARFGNLNRQVNSQMRGMSRSISKSLGGSIASGISGSLRAVGREASELVSGIARTGGVGAALFGGAALKTGFDRLTTIEDATTSLETIMGSAAEAGALMDEVLKTVQGTPFNLDQFATAAKNMVAFGIPAEKVPGYLTAIGEAAAASGKGAEGVDRITEAFGRIAASGQVSLQEIWTISDSGVNALAILANGFGVSTDEMKDMISSGAVPAGEALDLLTTGIVEGSEGAAGSTVALGGAMENLRGTTSGALSGLGAAVARFGASVLEPVLDKLPGLADGASAALDNLGGRLGDVIGGWIDSPAVQGFFDLLVDGLERLGSADIGGFLDKFKGLGAVFAGVGGGLATFTKNIPFIGNLLPVLSPITGIIIGIVAAVPEAREAFAGLFPVLLEAGQSILDVLMPALAQLIDALTPLIPVIVEVAEILIEAFAAALVEAIPVVADVLSDIAGGFAEFLAAVPPGVLAGVVGGIAALWAILAINPVVLVIGAIVALGYAVVRAYEEFDWFKNAVDTAWQLIQEVTRTAWTSFLKPTFEAIGSFIQNTLIPAWKSIWPNVKEVWAAVVQVVAVYWEILQAKFAAVKWYITNVLIPVFKGIWEIVQFVWPAVVAIVQTYWGYLQLVFDLVTSYITGFLVPVITTIWSTMQTVWNAVVAVVQWAWNNVIQPLWTGIKAFIDTILLPVFNAIWLTMQAVWNTVSTIVVLAWQAVIQPLWMAIKFFIDTVLIPVFNTIWTTMQTVWDTVGSIVSVAWNEVIKPIWDGVISFINETFLPAFDKIKTFISGVWDAIKSGASSAWDGIVGVIRGAVNGAINVINAIIGGINLVVGIIPGVDPIDKIPLLGENVGKPSGNRDTSGGSGANGPPLAVGGRLIPKELARMGPFRTNGPQAIVGEGNPRYPEYVIPTDPKYRGRALGLAAAMANDLGTPIPMMGIGGILGDAWDSIKGVASGIREGAATLAFKPANDAAKALIGQIPVKFLRDSIDGVREGIYNWVRGKEVELGLNEPTPAEGGGGGATPRGGGIAGLREPVAGIAARMLALGGGRIHIVSGWRDSAKQRQLYAAYLAGTGNLAAKPGTSKHERGLAVDWGGSTALYQRLARSMGAHFPVRGEPWHMEVPGYKRGGVLPFVHANSFDSGGVLEPGWNMVRNDTGAPEAVSPNGGPAVAIGEAHFHEGVDYDLFLRKTGFLAQAGVI